LKQILQPRYLQLNSRFRLCIVRF